LNIIKHLRFVAINQIPPSACLSLLVKNGSIWTQSRKLDIVKLSATRLTGVINLTKSLHICIVSVRKFVCTAERSLRNCCQYWIVISWNTRNRNTQHFYVHHVVRNVIVVDVVEVIKLSIVVDVVEVIKLSVCLSAKTIAKLSAVSAIAGNLFAFSDGATIKDLLISPAPCLTKE